MTSAVPRRFTRAFRTGTAHGSGMAPRLSAADLRKPYLPGHAAENKRAREIAAQVESVRAAIRARREVGA